MTNRYMHNCSTTQLLRGMPIKSTAGYHIIPVRLAFMKKTKDCSVSENVKEKKPLPLLEMDISRTIMEKSMEVPLKDKNRITI
jgi:hypothetical protein